MAKPRSKEELEAALEGLKAEYDRYCMVSLTKTTAEADEIDRQIASQLGWRGRGLARAAMRYAEIETVAQYRAKMKALYWALGEEEL
jgi:hypothetical protein